jgi:hypothetical protein
VSAQGIIVKTLLAVQPQLIAQTQACGNPRCFEVLGFDVMLREDLYARFRLIVFGVLTSDAANRF